MPPVSTRLLTDDARPRVPRLNTRTSRLTSSGLANAPWVVAAAASTLLAAWLYRIGDGWLGIPWAYNGDALSNGMLFKAVAQDGGIWDNSRLGAPFAQHYQDFPFTDLLPVYLGRALSVVTGGWAATLNLVYLLTFPLVAVSGWWVMRKLGVSTWVACALSVVYALAPYHFARGEGHLYLAGYYGVPLAVWLAVTLLGRDPLFPSRDRGPRLLRHVTWSSARTVAFCVVIALTSVYYMAFAWVMLGAVVAVNLLRRRWRHAASGVVVLALMAAAFLVAASPTLLYRAENGPNVLSGTRAPSDTEAYGLKLSQMLLPTPGHRIDALAELRQRYVTEFPVPGESPATALGLVASLGLVLLLLRTLALLLSRRGAPDEERQGELAFLALVLFLVGTVGGLATILSLLLTSQVRGWNRISIVLAFLALTALGLVIDRVAARWRAPVRTLVLGPSLVLIVLVGAWDQFSPAFDVDFGGIRTQFLDDGDFFGRVEQLLPAGAAVYQLPVIPYPEPLQPRYADMDPYDPMRPYLHTDDLRWSYGGIEGRLEFEWQRRLAGMSTAELLPALVASGFDALYIDRFGYEDRAAGFETEVRAVVDGPPLVSRNGRMAVFDLRPYAERLGLEQPGHIEELRADLLFPVFSPVIGRDYRFELEGDVLASWSDEDPAIPVANESTTAQWTLMSFELMSGNGAPANFTIVWPDGHREAVVAGSTPVGVSHEFLAEPGLGRVRIDSDAISVSPPGERRDLNFRIRARDVSPAPGVPAISR